MLFVESSLDVEMQTVVKTAAITTRRSDMVIIMNFIFSFLSIVCTRPDGSQPFARLKFERRSRRKIAFYEGRKYRPQRCYPRRPDSVPQILSISSSLVTMVVLFAISIRITSNSLGPSFTDFEPQDKEYEEKRKRDIGKNQLV